MAVDNLSNGVYDSLVTYFKALSEEGYMSQGSVNKLLVYVAVQELVEGDMSVYVTEDDYRTLCSIMECISGNCLIPYRRLNRSASLIPITATGNARLTENILFRYTQSDNIRVTQG